MIVKRVEEEDAYVSLDIISNIYLIKLLVVTLLKSGTNTIYLYLIISPLASTLKIFTIDKCFCLVVDITCMLSSSHSSSFSTFSISSFHDA